MTKKNKYFIQKIFHCPENPTPFHLLQQKWYPKWTRINGYLKWEDAEKALKCILKKDYDYDKDCSYRISDVAGKVMNSVFDGHPEGYEGPC